MNSSSLRLSWFVVLSSILVLGTQLLSDSFVSTAYAVDTAPPLSIVRSVAHGAQVFTGSILSPSACYELNARVVSLDRTHVHLSFERWQLPHLDCPKTPTEHFFQVQTFAPADVVVTASIDNEATPLTIHTSLSH
jgi:hypothetical protein